MKKLMLAAVFLILLSAQSVCGEEGFKVKNVEICTIIPLNIEYPLFEYGSCENLTFGDGKIASVFKFNNTTKKKIITRLQNNERVDGAPDNNTLIQSFIEFGLTNHPNYSIFLLPDMLVIRYETPSGEWLNDSEYCSEKTNVSDVVKESIFGDSPILPRLGNVRPLYENEWFLKDFTVITVDQSSTKPHINDSNLESYARFLFQSNYTFMRVERTGGGEFYRISQI